MHVEKNVSENLFKTLFGEKDSPSVRVDLQQRNIRRHLWLRRVDGQVQRAFLPDAPYVLTKAERQRFLDTLKRIKLPSHYSSTLYSKISKGKLSGLKSHDFHVLLHDIMPLCMRNCECPHLTAVVVRINRMFKRSARSRSAALSKSPYSLNVRRLSAYLRKKCRRRSLTSWCICAFT